jgi:hypothetical protein
LHHLPPHLREVCQILAAGLLRLRIRTVEDSAAEEAHFGPNGESSLHFLAEPSVCANPTTRRPA